MATKEQSTKITWIPRYQLVVMIDEAVRDERATDADLGRVLLTMFDHHLLEFSMPNWPAEDVEFKLREGITEEEWDVAYREFLKLYPESEETVAWKFDEANE